MRHPASLGAMTVQDIAKGLRFRSYEPGQPGSVWVGEFTSDPYQHTREEHVIDIQLDNESTPHTVELCVLGIMRSSDGTWSTRLTVADADE